MSLQDSRKDLDNSILTLPLVLLKRAFKMESKAEEAHFKQEKEGESVTLKIRFSNQFKQTIGSSEDGSSGSCMKCFNIALSVLLLVRISRYEEKDKMIVRTRKFVYQKLELFSQLRF